MVQTHSAAVLALMASGDKKYNSLVRDITSSYDKKRYDPNEPDCYHTLWRSCDPPIRKLRSWREFTGGITGQMDTAENYNTNAGPELRKITDGLFE